MVYYWWGENKIVILRVITTHHITTHLYHIYIIPISIQYLTLTHHYIHIVIATLNLGDGCVTQSRMFVYLMNLSIYLLPPFLLNYMLTKQNSVAVQRLIIGSYVLVYLLPVILVVSNKLKVARSTALIDGGTFCFKPSRRIRWTFANAFLISGFFVGKCSCVGVCSLV